jgi:hypothetical protein
MLSIVEELTFNAVRDEAAKHSGCETDHQIVLPNLGVTLEVTGVDAQAESSVVTAEIIALHKELRSPIAFMAVGSAEHVAASAQAAAEQWFEVVYPVLHSLFADHPTNNVVAGKLAAVTSDGRQYFWRIHVGPMRAVYAGGHAPELPKETGMLEATLNAVTGRAGESAEPFWLDSYAAKKADGEVLAECRLNNAWWQQGTSSVAGYASKIELLDNFFVSHRQFMFFKPDFTLAAEMQVPEVPAKRRWWSRLFGAG